MTHEPEITLGDVDCDGALAEAAERLWGTTRGGFLRATVLGGSALLTAVVLPAPASAALTVTDRSILNFALSLEYLQSSFYTEAERLKTLRGETAMQARTVGAHERAHVEALRGVLGSAAVKRPSYNFRGVTEDPDAFRKTAVAFEDLSVAAYAGQAWRIQSKAYLAAALGILSVEARHASWIRRLAGLQPAARPFDEPRPRSEVIETVRRTRFVEAGSAPKTTSRSRPRYTG